MFLPVSSPLSGGLPSWRPTPGHSDSRISGSCGADSVAGAPARAMKGLGLAPPTVRRPLLFVAGPREATGAAGGTRGLGCSWTEPVPTGAQKAVAPGQAQSGPRPAGTQLDVLPPLWGAREQPAWLWLQLEAGWRPWRVRAEPSLPGAALVLAGSP